MLTWATLIPGSAAHSAFSQMALGELGAQAALIRDLKGRQFQLYVGGLPVLLGLLGTGFGFLTQFGGDDPVPLWVPIFPLASIVVASVSLTVFMQKSASLSRHGAYSMILQKALATGRVPARYRGFEDAFATYNNTQRARWKVGTAYGEGLELPNRGSNVRVFPNDYFRLFVYLTFALAGLVSLLQGVLLAFDYWRADPLAAFSTIGLILFFTLLWVPCGIYGSRVHRGRYSFVEMRNHFEIIMCECAEFDRPQASPVVRGGQSSRVWYDDRYDSERGLQTPPELGAQA